MKLDGCMIISKIRNPNLEAPAFAGAASRRQAKQIQNSNVQNSNTLVFVQVIRILDFRACFEFRASYFDMNFYLFPFDRAGRF
jgi:hypothetical protein